MADPNVYPLTFKPVFRDYIWGGRNLETLLGRDLPPGIVAESWEISGHPSSPTTVDAGVLAGLTLPQVLDLWGKALVGTRSRWATDRGKFPLLVKLLDANRPLSVQVHPPDEYALAHENGELGKAEMWYVLHAKPGAELIYGLSQETTPDEFRAALETGSAQEIEEVATSAEKEFPHLLLKLRKCPAGADCDVELAATLAWQTTEQKRGKTETKDHSEEWFALMLPCDLGTGLEEKLFVDA